MGSQTFYPVEGTVGMWCAIGLMLRVSVNRSQALLHLKKLRSPATAWARAAGDLQPVAAAASMDELLWPSTGGIDQFEKDWRGRRRRLASAAQSAAPEAAIRTPPQPRPDAHAERPAAAPRFVFTNEELPRG
jgi:hypothetical protein